MSAASRRTGFLLQPTYRLERGRAVVQLFGRLTNGGGFLVEDDRLRPYFFVRAEHAVLASGAPGAQVEPAAERDFAGRALVRVSVAAPGDVPPLRERLAREGAEALEADIRFPYRYLIDHEIRGGLEIEGEPEDPSARLLRFRDPVLRPATVRPRLCVLSLDLETRGDASQIFSAALVGTDADEVHIVAARPVEGAVAQPDERALLAAVATRIRELDPDLLVGWNVVDFDLQVLADRAHALGVPLELGRAPGAVRFLRDLGFTRQPRAELPGRMVLDGIPLVRDALRLEDYRLATVARAVLGRGKLIDAEAVDAVAEIERRYRDDPEALVAYNREDARLVLEILEREGLLELAIERSLLSGMQLDRVGASIASFDLLYLPELRRRGYVAPSVDPARKPVPVRGGAVLDSVPGIFRGVAVFDFRSLYPSLIRTFNLDPLAHALGGPDALVAPNGARFSRHEAILPGVIERFMERRARARERGDRHADQAIKIMTNALFGVLGAGACRFFDAEIANAITGFGQQTLAWACQTFEAQGVRVLYGDTDSVFVELRSPEPAAARAEGEALRGEVEARIAERIRAEYGVEPRLHLELETVFERFFMPRVRGGESGSKKRYAGLADGRLVVVGLEAVRRDWPAVARRLQEGMLLRLFRDEPVAPFAAEVARALRAGELDRELVYVKRVRKGSVDRYTDVVPPHVQAARKAGAALAGAVVRYVITSRGPEPVQPGAPLPPDLDRAHYVEKVLRPIADAILAFQGTSFDGALGAPVQLSLLGG